MTPRNPFPSEQSACIDLWTSIWPEDPPGYFDRYFADPDWQPEYTQVVEVDGRLVSAAHVVKRIAQVGNLTLTVGGIANVVTLPEFRGRGFARSVVNCALDVMRWDAFDIALLFTDVHGFYEPSGFEIWPLAFTRASDPRPSTQDESMFDVRIATGQDTDSLDSLYHHLHSETPLSFRRSSAYRRCWIEPRLREMQSETIVAVVDGFIGAYVIVKRCVPSPEIVEWAGESAPLEVLLRYVWDRYCADSDSVVIANGSSPAIIQACHRVFTAVETMSYKEAMVASVDVSQWMVGLVPHLTESWLIAGKPQGCVTVRDRQGAITLTTKNGAPRAVPAAPGSPEITGARWVRMILGDQTAMPSNEEPELSWLSNLLPVRPGIFWEADAF